MHRLRLVVPLLGLGIVLAACSSTGATQAPAAATAAPTTAPSVAASAAPPSAAPSEAAASGSPSAGGATVNLATTTLGSVLVDGAGKTLYIFTADSGGKSACSGGCATAWPPLTGTAVTPGTGLDAGDFATITRDDGSTQVTFYGMPLYTFASDAAAGDTKGQGLNGKWFVVGADGKPIK